MRFEVAQWAGSDAEGWSAMARLQKEIDAIRSRTGTEKRRLEPEGLAFGSSRQGSRPLPCPA